MKSLIDQISSRFRMASLRALVLLLGLPALSFAQDLGESMAAIAEKQHELWQGRDETDPQVAKMMQQYWSAVGVNHKQDDFRESGLPWSAAFVSWVVKEAGAGDRFNYNAAHCFYVAAAKNNLQKKNDNPFKAHRVSEVKLEVGDLVCNSRGRGDRKATYEKLNTEDFYPTHCDVVVAVTEKSVTVIGGNVSNTVTRRTIQLDSNGHVQNSRNRYIAIVKVGR